MDQFIERIEILGLHGRSDIELNFSQGVNIVHGINGAGKTTLLHALTNAANLDLDAFSTLTFHTIRLFIASGPLIELSTAPDDNTDAHRRIELRLDGALKASWPPTPEELAHRSVTWRPDSDGIEDFKRTWGILVEATYFPAFRTIGEAWSFIDLGRVSRGASVRRPVLPGIGRNLRAQLAFQGERRPSHESDHRTAFARSLFGGFVPSIQYPSPREIQLELDEELQSSVNRLGHQDRTLMSAAFNEIFQSILADEPSEVEDRRTPDQIRISIGEQWSQLQSTQIQYGLPESDSTFQTLGPYFDAATSSSQSTDDTTTRILRLYDRILMQRYHNLLEAFKTVREYIDAVNYFLDAKQLVTATSKPLESPRLLVKHDDGDITPVDVLSSGERQIAVLIYSASRLARGNIILVDEPELSLHIDWQRKIIEAMVQQLPAKQLIVCTHSPIIGAGYEDNLIALIPSPTAYQVESAIVSSVSDWTDDDIFEDPF